MPGIYDDDQFVNNRPTKFNGRVRELLDDVEGQYGVQKSYHFYDVEVLETLSGDPYIAKDDEFTAYCKQSRNPNSKDAAVTKAWNAFSRDHFGHPGGVRMVNFYDKLLTFEEIEVTEGGTDRQGNEISPGVFICPVAEVESGKPRGKKSAPLAETATKAVADMIEDAEEESHGEPNPQLVDLVLGMAAEGTTKAILKRELNSKGGRKKALEEAGGLEALLSYLSDRIVVDGQQVSVASEDSAEEPEDDEPF